jgi:hypothetical protein
MGGERGKNGETGWIWGMPMRRERRVIGAEIAERQQT